VIQLYLARHAESILNKKQVYYGSIDCPLSEQGRKQAEGLKNALQGIKFDTVITSPLKRAVDTAKIIRDEYHTDLLIDERLKEVHFGQWEGMHYKEIQEKDPEHWDAWVKDWKHARPPGGEAYMELYERVKTALQYCILNYENQTLLIISHQGCLRIILSILLGLGEEGYWHFALEQGMYSMVELEQGHCTIRKMNTL
jgi:alpha-ribazole phosphatase